MKAENKYSLMFWSILILIVLNVSTLATIFYQKHQANTPANNLAPKGQRALEANTEKFSGRFFRERLQLNEEQMDDFRSINRQFREKASYLTDSLAIVRMAMLTEMEQDLPDTAILTAYSHQIGNMHAELKIVTYQYYLNLKSICTPEQQMTLKEMFGKMFYNDSRMDFPGRGGRHGKGKGMGMGREGNVNN